jgi:hypothetical protein
LAKHGFSIILDIFSQTYLVTLMMIDLLFFFVAQLFHRIYPMGGYRDVADVAFLFYARSQAPINVGGGCSGTHLKISILDTSCEHIIHGYKSMSIDTIM